MPLGLLASGWRTADREARALLGPRRSSIFAIPPAPVWQAPTYGAADQLCRDLTGNEFSAQALGLRRKLLDGPNTGCAARIHCARCIRACSGRWLDHPWSTRSTRRAAPQRRALLAGEAS